MLRRAWRERAGRQCCVRRKDAEIQPPPSPRAEPSQPFSSPGRPARPPCHTLQVKTLRLGGRGCPMLKVEMFYALYHTFKSCFSDFKSQAYYH